MYLKNNEIIKESRVVIDKYENQIIELQNENQMLRQEYKMHIFNTNKERETLMTTIQKERVQLRSITEDNANSRTNYNNDYYDIKNKIYNNKKNLITKSEYEANKLKKINSKNNIKSNEKKNKNNNSINKTNENDVKSNKNENICTTHGNYLATDPNRLKITGESRKKNFIYGKGDMQIYKDNYFLNEIEDKQYEHEEFIEIIKSVGLSLAKYEELTRVKFFSEFTEIIEMLLNLIKEKEKIINILQREIDNLNANNFKLNKDNMFLFNQNLILKKELNSGNNNLNKINNKKYSEVNNNLNKVNEIKINPKIKNSIHNYKEYLNINQKENRTPTDELLDINRVIIESSLDMESSTLKQKFEKEKMKKENKTEETSVSNGLSSNSIKENEKKNIKENNNLFVRPILEKNEKNDLNENLLIEKEKNEENNIDDSNLNKKINNKKIDNNNLYKNTINNKYMGTIISVTSSEFKEGCPGVDSFLSTIKFDETKKM